MRTYFKIAFIIITFFTSIGCTSPTAVIRSDIDRFKKEYPQNITTLKVKTRTLGYAWSGNPEARPIIFVHGSPGSWEGWSQFLLNTELQKTFHLIAVDRPGYGASESGKTEASLKAQADDILEVLNINRSHKPAILVGHSYGGPVIARAVMDHPEQIAGLVFVASSVSPDLEKVKWFQYPATWWPIRIIIPEFLRVCNEEIFALKLELSDLSTHWKTISAKSVLIQGEDDDLVPQQNLDFLLKNLKNKTIVDSIRVPHLDHFIPWKRPDLILRGIRELDSAIN